MTRKIKIEKIESKESQRVTFSKRRSGLLKKAGKLCSLSDAQIAIVTFSLAGRPFSFGHPSADSVVDHILADNTNSSSSNESSNDKVHGPSPSPSSSKGVAGTEGHSWWALPIADMDLDLDGLQQYKASLEALKINVAHQLEEMKKREAITRDFIGLLDAP